MIDGKNVHFTSSFAPVREVKVVAPVKFIARKAETNGIIKKYDIPVNISGLKSRTDTAAHIMPVNNPFNENDLKGMKGRNAGTITVPIRKAPR